MLIVLLYVDDIITVHTRGTSVSSAWADDICRTLGQQQVLVAYGSTPQHGASCPVNSLQNFYLLVMLGLKHGTSRFRNETSTQ
eukprot:3793934-Pleurochrysis_carterae.AAC.1